jgi:lipoyl(octanoyl) transferase
MKQQVYFHDLDSIDYKECWDLQERLLTSIVDGKMLNRDKEGESQSQSRHYLLFCEHPHVFTLGKSGSADHLLADENILKAKQATFYKINRGGDITYHGPGQLVGYPIFDLDFFFNDIHKYLRFLEEAIILTCADYGLAAGRIPGLTGVWLDIEDPIRARKICAFGVRCSRWVTMHGFAFNVNADLSYFNMIVPCGITDKGVTSLQKELGREIDLEEVKAKVLLHMQELFNFSIQTPPNETLPWMENDSITSA